MDAERAERATWRAVVAALVAFDAARLAWMAGATAATLPLAPLEPGPLALARYPWALAALATAAALAALWMLRRPWRITPSVLALVTVGLLFEAFAHARGTYHQNFYQLGAVLFGRVAGQAIAWGLGRGRALPARRALLTELAFVGSVAGLGAAYFCAGLVKLLHGGLGWVSPDWIRLVLSEYRQVAPGAPDPVTDWTLSLPWLAWLGSAFTLAAELGGLALGLGQRPRAWAARALLVFHAVLAALSGIFFYEGAQLLFIVALPWRWIARRFGRAGPSARPPTAESVYRARDARRAWVAVLVAALVAALAWALPIPRRVHPGEVAPPTWRTDAEPTAPAPAPGPGPAPRVPP